MNPLTPGQRVVLAKHPSAEWITPNPQPEPPAAIRQGPSMADIIAKYGRGVPLPTPPEADEQGDTEVVIALVHGRLRTFLIQGDAIVAENG